MGIRALRWGYGPQDLGLETEISALGLGFLSGGGEGGEEGEGEGENSPYV